MDKKLSPEERQQQALNKIQELDDNPPDGGSNVICAMSRMMIGAPRIVDIPLPSRAHNPD